MLLKLAVYLSVINLTSTLRQTLQVPSGSPSSVPTIVPTSVPTSLPFTSKPTSYGETNLPTSSPTSTPLVQLDNYGSLRIYNDFQRTHARLLDSSSQSLWSPSFIFGSFNFKGVAVVGNCFDWKSFTSSATNPPIADSLSFFSMQAVFDYQYYFNFPLSTNRISVTCDNSTIVNNFIWHMQSSVPYSVSCGNHIWRIVSCSFGLIFCIDCKKVCDVCPSSIAPDILDQAGYYGVGGGFYMINSCKSGCYIHRAASYGILNIFSRRKQLFPSLLEHYVRPGLEGNTVYVKLSKPGRVICGGMYSGIVPQSVYDIIKNEPYNSYYSSGVYIYVTLSSLLQSTNYDIYCYTEDFMGNSMDLETMLTTKRSILTACCRQLEFSATEAFFYLNDIGDKEFPNVFSLSIDSISKDPVFVSLSVRSCIGQTLQLPSIYPKSFVFSAGNWFGLTAEFSIAPNVIGCFVISASVSPSNLYLSNELIVTIASHINIPPVPEIEYAKFTDDARELLIQLTSVSDYGRFDPLLPFQCSRVFVFVGGVYSTCYWMSPSRVRAVLGEPFDTSFTTTVNLKAPHYFIALNPNILRPACADSHSLVQCAEYPTSSNDRRITIEHPRRYVYPSVALLMSRIVSYCVEKICFDATNSEGHFGRPWLIVEWRLDINRSNFDFVDEIRLANINQAFKLVSTNTAYKPICLPLFMFDKEVYYTVYLTLTNFFGYNGTLSKTFFVSNTSRAVAADVAILSPFSLTITRNQNLFIAASAKLSTCLSTTVVDINYTWKMYLDDIVFQQELSSKSLNPSIFSLGSYVLNPNSKYTLQVRVVILYEYEGQLLKENGMDFIIINVISSGISATITGSQIRTVGLNDEIFLDASGSHSIDYPYSDYSDIFFKWNCIEVFPVFGSSCQIFSHSLVEEKLSAQLVMDSTSNRVYNFSVLVTDSNDNYASAWSVINVKNVSLPSVVIFSDDACINPDSELILRSNVTFIESPGLANFDILWKSSLITLSSSVMTPLQLNVPFQTFQFPLALIENSLSAGMSYTFSLVYSFSIAGFDGLSSITISVNSPPSGGILSIMPIVGFALNTSFSLTSLFWVDDDGPISYSFYYHLLANTEMYFLKSQSPIHIVQSYLPSGLLSTKNKLVCSVRAFDIYNAGHEISSPVTVLPGAISQQIFNRTLYFTKLLNNALAHVDGETYLQIISVTSTLFSYVSCEIAPQCALLFRYPCSFVPNTCGRCLPGYFGLSQESNIPCRENLPSSALAVLYVPDGGPCQRSSQCASSSCFRKICLSVPKLCPNFCSKHGQCLYTDFNGYIVGTCLKQDAYCMASCTCDQGWSGSDCSIPQIQQSLIIPFREVLCLNIPFALSFIDFSKNVYLSVMYTLRDLTLDSFLLTRSSFSKCFSAMIDIMSLLESSDIFPDNDMISVTTAVMSNMFEFVHHNLDYDLSNVITRSQKLYSSMLYAIQSSIVQRQFPITFLSKNIRVSLSSSPELYTIVSTEEILYNKTPSYFFWNYTLCTNCPRTVIEYTKNIFTDATPTISSVVAILIANRRPVQTSFTLQNLSPMKYWQKYTNLSEVHCALTGFQYSVTVCREFSVTCPGILVGKFKYYCPTNESYPVCMAMVSYGSWNSSICKAVEYNSQNTRCVCDSNYIIKTDEASLTYYFVKYYTNIYNFTAFFVTQELPNRNSGQPVVYFLGFFGSAITIIMLLYQYFRTTTKESEINKVEKTPMKYYSAKWFFDKSLPLEFCRDSFLNRSGKLLRKFHPIASFEYPVGRRKQLKVVSLLFEILSRLLCISFLSFFVLNGYSLLDDGSCEMENTIQNCRIEGLNRNNLCSWNKYSEICTFNPPEVSIFDFIYLIAIVTLIASPFMSFNDYIYQCLKILSNPSIETSNIGVDVFVDEFQMTSTSKRCLFNKAARLLSMQRQIDFVNPSDELENMLIELKKQGKLRTTERVVVANAGIKISNDKKRDPENQNVPDLEDRFYTFTSWLAHVFLEVRNFIVDDVFKKAYSAYISWKELMVVRYLNVANPVYASRVLNYIGSSKGLALEKVYKVRAQMKIIYNGMNLCQGDLSKNIFLLQHFFLSCLNTESSGFIERVLLRTLWQFSKFKKLYFFLSVILVIVYTAGCAVGLFMYTLRTGANANRYWISLVLGSVVFDTFLLNPSKILMTKVVFLADLRREILSLCDILVKRAIFISRRCTGSMKTSKHLVQHFNPACRVSRLMPHLSISRLLINMNDNDMASPIVSSLPQYDLFRYIISPYLFVTRYIIGAFTWFLPDYFYNSLFDLVICILINVAFVIIAQNISAWASIGLFILLSVFLIFVGRYKSDMNSDGTVKNMISNRKALIGSLIEDGPPVLDDYFCRYLQKSNYITDDATNVSTKSKRRREREHRRKAIEELKAIRLTRKLRSAGKVVPVDAGLDREFGASFDVSGQCATLTSSEVLQDNNVERGTVISYGERPKVTSIPEEKDFIWSEKRLRPMSGPGTSIYVDGSTNMYSWHEAASMFMCNLDVGQVFADLIEQDSFEVLDFRQSDLFENFGPGFSSLEKNIESEAKYLHSRGSQRPTLLRSVGELADDESLKTERGELM